MINLKCPKCGAIHSAAVWNNVTTQHYQTVITRMPTDYFAKNLFDTAFKCETCQEFSDYQNLREVGPDEYTSENQEMVEQG